MAINSTTKCIICGLIIHPSEYSSHMLKHEKKIRNAPASNEAVIKLTMNLEMEIKGILNQFEKRLNILEKSMEDKK